MSRALTIRRVKSLLRAAARGQVLVVGDVMLDEFLWGNVRRISPEAPVPVVAFERESFMPGGAANVARNLTALGTDVELFGLVGKDDGAKKLRALLKADQVGTGGLKAAGAMTTRKTRVVAHQQQVVRIDRESRQPGDGRATRRLLSAVEKAIDRADARLDVCPTALAIPTQGPLDSFNARTYPACYVEWWFGDGAPGLERDRPMLFEQVTRRLINIEEH